MKKRVPIYILMLLMLAFRIPFRAYASSPSAVSIQQLYSSKIAYWDGEYEAHGRTISFHAPVFIPDVETMPVLTVTSNDMQDMTIPENMVLWDYWPNWQSFGKAEVLKTAYWRYDDYFYLPWSEEGKRDAATCFAENNVLSLADAIADAPNIVDQVWGEGVYGVLADHAQVLHPIKRKGAYHDFSTMPGWEAYTEKGVYILDLWLTLHGIPVFMGAGGGLEVSGYSTYSTLHRSANLSIAHYLKPDDYYCMMCNNLFKETGVLIEDIPLCPFEEIQREVERLIEKGNIRNVYSLRLGYVVFQKPDETYNYKDASYEMANAEYVAVPTWVVECTYAENAKAKIRTNPDMDNENAEEIAYYKRYGFKTLMIHAQTGKAYDPYSTQSSRQQYLKALRALPIVEW